MSHSVKGVVVGVAFRRATGENPTFISFSRACNSLLQSCYILIINPFAIAAELVGVGVAVVFENLGALIYFFAPFTDIFSVLFTCYTVTISYFKMIKVNRGKCFSL